MDVASPPGSGIFICKKVKTKEDTPCCYRDSYGQGHFTAAVFQSMVFSHKADKILKQLGYINASLMQIFLIVEYFQIQ